MLSFGSSEIGRDGRLERRRVLQVGGLAASSLTLADCLRARASGTAKPDNETAVIHVFMGGGPSHIDTFDPKPDATSEIRGEFRTIATKLPGVQFTELLPHMAQAIRQFAVVRSVSHTNPNHLPASHWMMTGYQPPVAAKANFNPYVGAVTAKIRGPNIPGMPAYVSVPWKQLFGGAAYLGPAYKPFTTESDPGLSGFSVPLLQPAIELDASRLRDRLGLRRDLERIRGQCDAYSESSGMDGFTRQAMDILTGSRAQAAFDLDRESIATRERYGRTSCGQRCLLARRLVEAGVTFVTVLSGGEWDTHADNFRQLRQYAPMVDRGLAALVSDLYERGLEHRILLVVSGEFGRTPTINKNAGRDHWPGAFTVLFAGGGVRGGRVIGGTDRHGGRPITRPYSPGDVLATVYGHLGIDIRREFLDRGGRPLPILAEGDRIAELYS